MRLSLIVTTLISLWLFNPGLHAQEAPVAGHRFACIDYHLEKVFIFSADGRVEWEYSVGDELCYGLSVLTNGNVLCASASAAKEVTPEKQVVFAYQRPKPGHYPIGLSACQRLANGNTLIADGAARKMLEVVPDGKIAKEVALPGGKEAGGLRGACQLDNGNYLVCHYQSPGRVCEYDPQGKVLREIPVPGGATCAVRLANGNTLISYKGAGVCEVAPDGTTVWECPKIKGSGLPVCVARLPNGNTLITYCLCFRNKQYENGKPPPGAGKGRPHVVEVTPEGAVVWSFTDPSGVLAGLSAVQLLDETGTAPGKEREKPIQGEADAQHP